VMANKNRLLVFRPGVTCRPDQASSFLQDALTIIDALQSSGTEIDVDSIQQPRSVLAEAGQMGGLLGSLVKRRVQSQAIGNDAITRFLQQPVPRQIPRPLRNQVKGDPFLVFMGLGFGFGGLVGSIIALSVDADLGEKLGFFALAGACFLVGGLILFLVKFFERRRMKLLTHGTLRDAIVFSVTPTAFVNGNQRVFEAKFRITDEAEQECSARIQGLTVNAAKVLAETGEPTRVLQDSKNPNRFLLIDCHAIE
ncbi:MAG: hypothetical protein ACR2NP_14710, partial [Pirellulaceae bacterium]